MLAPQYSLRRLLAWVTVSAFVCLIAAAAARGQIWAVAFLVALFGFVVLLVVHSMAYLLLGLVSLVRDRRRGARLVAPRSKSPPA